ncbi:hypothetical protein Droror1_Dr00007541 [Drosera rotundifolia]
MLCSELAYSVCWLLLLLPLSSAFCPCFCRAAENPSNSSILHQFLISDPIQHFNAYGSDVRSTNPYPESLGLYNPTIQSLGERMSRSINLVQDHGGVVSNEQEMSHTRHMMDLFGTPSEANRLSLSLGSQGFVPGMQFRQGGLNSDLMSSSYLIASQEPCNSSSGHVLGDYTFPGYGYGMMNRSYSNSYLTEPLPNAIGNSRFLKAAQLLLEEAVNVGGRDIELSDMRRLLLGGRAGRELSSKLRAELLCNEFVPADKHELQIRISKLIGLLEQVEGRYEEYTQRMEQLVSSFEVLAGEGAAKTYTSLALQAMSRHFCSLRDAIVSQIKQIRKKLYPELPRAGSSMSQLSLFDREGRQSRISLEQFGVIPGQKQAWRPIRGLPETSVAILRAWLFEHFLHPYPNDAEKLILASQTGLSKNQVSNWFINARVRLWKPMIEEMYKDEFGDSSVDSDSLFSGSSATADLAEE